VRIRGEAIEDRIWRARVIVSVLRDLCRAKQLHRSLGEP